MKVFLLFISLIAAVAFCDRQLRRQHASGNGPASAGTVVVTYHDNAELIAKLRQVNAGQRFEMHALHDGERIDTGISCSDHAAVAAYEERMNRQAQAESRQIEAELRRITGQNVRVQ